VEYVSKQLVASDLSGTVAYPGFFFFGGGSTNSVDDRGQRERGLGAVAPWSGVPLCL
jgi:hypothetical protein